MNLVLNHSNLMLVNRIRIAAQRESSDLDILRFFAEPDYARGRLLAFAATGRPELSLLARKAADQLLPRREAPAVAAAPAARSPLPQRITRGPAAVPLLPAAGIAATDAGSRFPLLKAHMNQVAVESAGIRATMFVLRLERAGTLGDLADLLPEFHALAVGAAGPEAIDAVRRELESALAGWPG